jgi:HSP20 family protein
MTLLRFHTLPRQYAANSSNGWRPAVDIVELGDRFVLSADLPGVSPGDIDVSMKDRLLTIRGERRGSNPAAESRTHVNERRYGSFERQFTLPANVDGDAIAARCEHGTLHVDIPKQAVASARRIEVAAA